MGTPEPFDNGPRLGVELQILSLVQQVLMRQQMMEEASRSQEVALLTKIDDLQHSMASKVLTGLEQTQCLVGGLHVQLMNTQAQVQALLIGQAQLQAQISRQIAVANPMPSRQPTKEAVVVAEMKPQQEIKKSDTDTLSTAPVQGKRKRPGSRTRRRARYNSNRSLPEPLQQIEDVASEEENSSAGTGEVANLAELENMFDNAACLKASDLAAKDDAETDDKLALPCVVSRHDSSEFEADASSCGGGSPQSSPSRRFVPSLSASSFCLEAVDNPQECLSPEVAFLSSLIKLRNGENDAAEECMKMLEDEESAGINARSQGGRSTLHIAVRCQHEQICHAILARPDFTEINAKYRGCTALTLAAEKRLTGVCLAMLERPDFTEINAKTTGRGETVLHMAAANGLLDVCQRIMKRGDFHAVNATTLPRSMGCTAAEVAESCGHGEVAALIRNLGGR